MTGNRQPEILATSRVSLAGVSPLAFDPVCRELALPTFGSPFPDRGFHHLLLGRRRQSASRAAAGFTLIEILVVVVILAVLAATVSLAISGAGGERQLQHEAERAQALITYACERAELTGRPIGLSFDMQGYRFSQFDREVWKPYRADELRARDWPANVSVSILREGRKVDIGKEFPITPQLLCRTSGELTPFRADLALPDLARYYRLDGQLDGHVTLVAIDVHEK